MATDQDCEERVLCGEEWKVEAQAVIHDVQDHVHQISIADGEDLVTDDQQIYLNLTTKEMLSYCVELTAQGFRIVGQGHNQISGFTEEAEFYETLYALLDKISPLYRQAFGNSLVAKLQELQDSSEVDKSLEDM